MKKVNISSFFGFFFLFGVLLFLFSGCSELNTVDFTSKVEDKSGSGDLTYHMDPKTVELNSKVTLSYKAMDPETFKVLYAGEKTGFVLDAEGTEFFHLLQGAQEGESRSEILQDPFSEYSSHAVTKQSAVVLREMGIPLVVGEHVPLGEQEAVIVNIVRDEKGVEFAMLDSNDRSAREPLLWDFTIIGIH